MLATIVDVLTEPFAQGLLRRALLEIVLLGVVGGALGCWVVLAELAYGAESLAHGMFPGLVVAALAGAALLLGGAAGIVVAALAVALAGRLPGIGRDTAIAVVVTALFGLGVLLARAPDAPARIPELLFGDVLGTSVGDLVAGAALAAVVLAALWLLHWRLLAVGFDRSGARALGASPAVADAALAVLLAAAILVAVQGLGNLLVVSILVGPAATARLLADRMPAMMALAVGIAIVAGIGGLLVSYHAETAAGASIALATVALWALARAARALRARRLRPAALPSKAA